MWNTEGKPRSDDDLCVIQFEDDYAFAYWVEGCNAWDSPDKGFIDDEYVKGWIALPGLLI
jgi:hypothetical protein